ncbi:MAG: PAS domain S-box protein [Bacteroidota bacterium]
MKKNTLLVEANINIQKEIDERIRIAAALEESLTRLNTIADQVPGMVYQFHVRSDGTSCFPYSSEGIRDIYRLSPEDVSKDASPVFSRLHPEDFDGVVASIEQSSKNLALWRYEYRVKFEDGVVRWLLGNAMPKNETDGSVIWHGFITDITDRKLIEAELEESKEKYRGLSEASFEAIFISEKGKCIEQNLAAEKMFGYTSEEALTKYGTEWIVPEDRDMVMAKMISGYTEPYESTALRKDGTTFPCILGGKMMFYKGKNVRVTSLTDISKRKQAEEEVKQVSARLSLATRAGGVGIWDFDVVNNILVWDGQMFALYGINKEDFGGAYEAWRSGLHPDDKARGDAEIEMALKGEKEFDTEFRVVWPNGTVRNIRAMSIVQHDESGRPLRMIGTNWDITEQKMAEETLRESEARFSVFMDYLQAAVFLKDHEGKTLFVNKYMDNAFGASAWLGKTMYEVIPNEFGKKLLADDLNSLKFGYQKIEESLLNLDNELRTYETQKFVMPRPGHNHLLGGIAIDITDRKKAEDEILSARKEAEKANHAKSEFLSRMSHELRTPMNSILGFAQLLQMGELTPGQNKSIKHIMTSGVHLLHLINEVLNIAQIEAGRISLLMEPVQLLSPIKETIDSVLPNALKKNVSIKLQESPNNQLFVKADLHRLKQVLLNLINNAVKYNKNEGSVIIKTSVIHSKKSKIPVIRISVIDTGIGISTDNLDKLFLPFERFGEKKSEIEGSGLGLTVVKKLMTVMGGAVGVDSVPGEGSTFWIELPQADSQYNRDIQSLQSTQLNTNTNFQAATVFYIEDNISNIELVEDILKNHRPEIHLHISKTGENAVMEAIEFTPDLILLDLDLPKVHGSIVFDNLKSSEKTCHIPVVIISADAMTRQIEKLVQAGAKDYLTKPLDIKAFLKMIDDWTPRLPQEALPG